MSNGIGRWWRLGVLGMLAGMLCSGCGGRKTESVTLAGSTAFQPFAEKLAEQFMASHPGTAITVQGGGSAVGIQSALLGTAQIGMADLVKLPAEAAALESVVAARDGIAVVVHPSNPVTDLTLDQVRGIFSGKVHNWKELGGEDRPVIVVSREEGSGTRSSFEDILGGFELSGNALVQDSNGTIRETVANDANAIGYLSHGLVNAKVKGLTIAGQPCTTEAVLAGGYPLVRPIFLLTKGPAQGSVRQFLDFVLSEAGQSAIRADGLIPAR